MKRRHLFEWEDQPWLPVVFRDFITDHLCFFLSHPWRDEVNQSMANHLKPLLTKAGQNQIVDLCAGAGGPLLKIRQILAQDLNASVQVTLTDLFPNIEAFRRCGYCENSDVSARLSPVSAFDVPADLPGVRTLFTSLHHFEPEGVRNILGDAAEKRQPIAIFEPLERTPRLLGYIAALAILQSFILTPFVGRMTFARFLFTYLIPIAPAIILWDGCVSVFRTYNPQELLALAESVAARDYHWESGRYDIAGKLGILMPTTYLIGWPK